MPTRVEIFGQRLDSAMERVKEELHNMLPSDLENLAKLLEKCRKDDFNYKFEK